MLSRMGCSNTPSIPLTPERSDIELRNLKEKLKVAEKKLEQQTEDMLQSDNHEIAELKNQVAVLEGHRDDNDNVIEELHMINENLEFELSSMQEENERLLKEIEDLKSRLDIRAQGV